VDHYIGGAEHAVLHLLYSRFWHKVLFDLGIVPGIEPFIRLTNQGLILAEDGQKMSKSLGNVINPDDVIAEYGADAMRLYEMFMGPLEMAKPWSTKGISGVRRFLDRVWRLYIHKGLGDNALDPESEKVHHQTIKKVTADIEALSFNTAISQMMIWVNQMQGLEKIPHKTGEEFLKLLAPFAPHTTEELWNRIGRKFSIHQETWPTHNIAFLAEDTVTIVFSVNGKPRDTVSLEKGLNKDTLLEKALGSEKVKKFMDGKK